MANQRHPDQRLIAFALPSELLSKLEAKRKSDGLQRSMYIRHAIFEKLKAAGVSVSDELKDAPDRAGKPHVAKKIASYSAELKAAKKKGKNEK